MDDGMEEGKMNRICETLRDWLDDDWPWSPLAGECDWEQIAIWHFRPHSGPRYIHVVGFAAQFSFIELWGTEPTPSYLSRGPPIPALQEPTHHKSFLELCRLTFGLTCVEQFVCKSCIT
jgi:hypothetical protein